MTVTSYLLSWNAAAVICLIVGVLLMIYEMFTPGMGLAALLGAIALVAAIVLSANSFTHALITLALILILLGVAAYFIFRAFSQGKLRRIVLTDSMQGEATPLQNMQELVGATGVCKSALRPAGIAELNGKRMDVVTEGAFIAAGASIQVEKVEGLRIVVKEV